MMTCSIRRVFAITAISLGAAGVVHAQTVAGPATTPAGAPQEVAPGTPTEVEWYSVHAQGTVISQKHDVFPANFTGPFDVPPDEPWKTSVTGTLFLGLRLPWQGGEIYCDPEISGGEGFGGVTGIAGFPNGEIPRVGSPEPQPYIARGFIRQTFNLGGEREHVEADQNQLAGYRDTRRFVLTFGKFAATDFFDNNAYAHDARTQFQNWSLMANGAWDYPADTRGYTYGIVGELYADNWTVRYGAFTMPKEANGSTIDWNIPKALGQIIEFEQRWTIPKLGGGAARPMAYLNLAHMGNYREAILFPGPNGPDVTLTRTYTYKYGFGVSAEQAITADLGLFARLGWNDGHTETFCFTEIDRTATLGASLKGTRWRRPDDVVGFAGAINALAKNHRDYIGAGGHGFIIGDGQLRNYAPEQILEAYYLAKVVDHVFVTADVQYIKHPAYNADRGPIFVGGLRVHVEL
ncbi:MAG TPA: carbohydrate porin [Tepidisphaeraceae bacterium]|jgi:high affinity Mn2+ porin